MAASRRRKKLGQHFLIDPQVIDNIVTLIDPQANQTIIEIGPGLGALTHHLLDANAQLHAVEIDSNLVRKLQHKYSADALTLHHGDALEFDFSAVTSTNGKLRIVGNLPYSISTPLLLRLAEYSAIIEDMCFMVQYEVAARLTAECGSTNYSRLTVNVARKFSTESIFEVEPDAFSPPPEVRSSIIVMHPKPQTSIDPVHETVFSDLVRMAFGNRRKTLRNSLRSITDEAMFQKAGIDAGLRAQNLSIKDFSALAECIISNASNKKENQLGTYD